MSFLKKPSLIIQFNIGISFVLGKLIYLAFFPINSRIYSPEDFSLFGMSILISEILLPIFTLSLHQAYLVSKDKYESDILISLSILSSILVYFIFLFLLIFAYICKVIENILIFQIIIFSSFIYSLSQSVYLFNVKNGMFRNNFIYQVIPPVVSGLYIMVSGIFFYSKENIVFGLLFGNIVGLILVGKKVKYFLYKTRESYVNFSLIKKYSEFPLYKTPQSFISSVSHNFSFFIILQYYGEYYAGIYSLARMVVYTPSNIIGKVIHDYCFITFSSLNKDEIKGKSDKIFVIYSIAILPMVILFFILSEEIFYVIFGEKWAEAGIYSSYIVFYLYFFMLNKVYFSAIYFFNKQKWLFFYEIKHSIVRAIISVIIVFIFDINIDYFLIITSILFSIYYIFMSIKIRNMI